MSKKEGFELERLQDFAHDFYVGGAGAVFRGDGVDDAQDVALHHADVVGVVFAGGEVAEVLDEVHDVCAVVH